jgi:hypothetical protein
VQRVEGSGTEDSPRYPLNWESQIGDSSLGAADALSTCAVAYLGGQVACVLLKRANYLSFKAKGRSAEDTRRTGMNMHFG